MANILVVDDEGQILDSVRRQLASKGHEVVARADAQAALTILQRNPEHFQLLVTDWRMIPMDGIDLIKSMKLFEELDEVAIILHTSADAGELTKALPPGQLERWGVRLQSKDRGHDHVGLLRLVEEMLT